MREKIFNLIEPNEAETKASKCYDFFMIFVILLSIIPLAFKDETELFSIIDKVTVVIFIIDYILRLVTADYKLKRGNSSYLRYIFTPMAIVDLLSILPSILLFNKSLKLLKVLRLARSLKVLKVFKSFRYSKSIAIIIRVFKREKEALFVVGGLAIGYILITALILFNVEPDTFRNFFNAVYWATISLTTVGYGDIFAISTIGKTITMISSFMGIAIVALPAGIITAGYMEEVSGNNNEE